MNWLPVVRHAAFSALRTPHSALRTPHFTILQSTILQSTILQSTIPQSTIPQSTIPQTGPLNRISPIFFIYITLFSSAGFPISAARHFYGYSLFPCIIACVRAWEIMDPRGLTLGQCVGQLFIDCNNRLLELISYRFGSYRLVEENNFHCFDRNGTAKQNSEHSSGK